MKPINTILAILFLLTLTVKVQAEDTWELVKGIRDLDIKEISIAPDKEETIYVASSERLYKSDDNGASWKVVFNAKGQQNAINFVTATREGVFVCAEQGLFYSNTGELAWNSIFNGVGPEESSTLHIAFSDKGIIYLGTGAGLFISSDNGRTWQKDAKLAQNLRIKWILVKEDTVFLVAEDGLYINLSNGWKRVFVASTEVVDYDADSTDEVVSAYKPVNRILTYREKLLLATDRGIFSSNDNGKTWSAFPSSGLISTKVKSLTFGKNLYAATDRGIFIFDENENKWVSLYKGIDTDETYSVTIDKKGNLWAATDKGVFRSFIKDGDLLAKIKDPVESEKESLLERFTQEPTINEVQEKAIKYAEVHPDKIEMWRKAAKRKALLPDVSIGMDRNVTDLYHWEGGSTGTINDDFLRKGKQAIEWDVSLTWDLGDLIWSTDQTSIDVRSRLMVQLRDDILDEVTRTYFERRRLQVDTFLLPPSDIKQKLEKELRIQELTADLDALTGGYFSEQIDSQNDKDRL